MRGKKTRKFIEMADHFQRTKYTCIRLE